MTTHYRITLEVINTTLLHRTVRAICRAFGYDKVRSFYKVYRIESSSETAMNALGESLEMARRDGYIVVRVTASSRG